MVWVTSGALGVYRSYLVSAHTMTVVLLLVAVVPLLTVGAPIQLGREAARRRKDGSRGGYEWARVLVRSRAAQLATQPIVAALIAAAMVWIFVSSDLIRWVAGDLLGRQVATAGILVSGFLLARGLTGDETRVCPPIRVRLLAVCVLAATMATIAAWTLGTAGLVAADWFGAMGRTWGPTPDVDQDLGGVALAVGSVVTLVLGARSVLQSRTPYEQSQELAAK